uniref:Hexosyltransferase n=1 Tax=Knipowitschia caucasica TaxID=637954 RepID=A0AAV2KSM7_KNICA
MAIGVLLLLILTCVHINHHIYHHEIPLNNYFENLTGEKTFYEEKIRDWPKCEPNTSAANISGFHTLPAHIQNFLFYRHFPTLLDIPDKCGGPGKSSDVFLLLVIKSSPGNYERREVLRKTWAQERKVNNLWIRRVFISGTSGSGEEKMRLNKLLRAEQNENNDIIQWDFDESFFNLTLKQILFLEWMEKNCPNTRFLLNGDDDVFANTDAMVEYLHGLPGNNGSSHLYTGFVFENTGPVRATTNKYFIPKQIQESNTYTPYCGGGGYLLSGYTAMVIHAMSKSIDVHPIDDVYVGMCVEKAGLAPTFHTGVKTLGLMINGKQEINLEQDPCIVKNLLLVHRFLPSQIYLMWDRINNRHISCGGL